MTGCPWDQKQTPESFKSFLIEETHELLEAINQGEPQQIKEELGDMYFQLTFLGQLYEERGDFTVSDAINAIITKMINRHPHVFGDEKVSSPDEQRRRWNELKSTEKATKKSATDLISGVPKSMPALRRAQRVSERASHNGFNWEDINNVLDTLSKETEKLHELVKDTNRAGIQDVIGNMLFSLVNVSRLSQTNAEEALLNATEKFISSFQKVNQTLQDQGREMRDTKQEELLELWHNIQDIPLSGKTA